MKKKGEYLKPVNVNKDVWFYDNPKTLHFIAWSDDPAGIRRCADFMIDKSLLRRHMKSREK